MSSCSMNVCTKISQTEICVRNDCRPKYEMSTVYREHVSVTVGDIKETKALSLRCLGKELCVVEFFKREI